MRNSNIWSKAIIIGGETLEEGGEELGRLPWSEDRKGNYTYTRRPFSEDYDFERPDDVDKVFYLLDTTGELILDTTDEKIGVNV